MVTTSSLFLACLGMAANAQDIGAMPSPIQRTIGPGEQPPAQPMPGHQMEPRRERMPPANYYDDEDPDDVDDWQRRRMDGWHRRMMRDWDQRQPWMQRGGPQGPMMQGPMGMMHGPMGMMGPGMGGAQMMRMMMILMDTDGDGAISLQEFQAAHERFFKAMDTDKDGRVTLEEFRNFWLGPRNPAQQPQQPQQPR